MGVINELSQLPWKYWVVRRRCNGEDKEHILQGVWLWDKPINICTALWAYKASLGTECLCVPEESQASSDPQAMKWQIAVSKATRLPQSLRLSVLGWCSSDLCWPLCWGCGKQVEGLWLASAEKHTAPSRVQFIPLVSSAAEFHLKQK